MPKKKKLTNELIEIGILMKKKKKIISDLDISPLCTPQIEEVLFSLLLDLKNTILLKKPKNVWLTYNRYPYCVYQYKSCDFLLSFSCRRVFVISRSIDFTRNLSFNEIAVLSFLKHSIIWVGEKYDHLWKNVLVRILLSTEFFILTDQVSINVFVILTIFSKSSLDEATLFLFLFGFGRGNFLLTPWISHYQIRNLFQIRPTLSWMHSMNNNLLTRG